MGAAALGAALRVNRSLVQCDLNCNELRDEGVEALLAGPSTRHTRASG